MKINLTTPLVIIKQPEIKETLTEVSIDRIVDIPTQKKVFVFINGQRIELEALSNDNYDVPNEWTNADIVSAVEAIYSAS